MPAPADSCCCKIEGAIQICGPPISSAAFGSGILFAIMSFIQGVVYVYFGRIILEVGALGAAIGGAIGLNTGVGASTMGSVSSLGDLKRVMETYKAGAQCGVAAGAFFLLATVVTLVLMFLAYNAKSQGGNFGVTWAKRIWMGHTVVMIIGYALGFAYSIIHIGSLVIIMTCLFLCIDIYNNYIFWSYYKRSEGHTLPTQALGPVVGKTVDAHTMPPGAQSGMYPGMTLQPAAQAPGYPGSHPGMQPPAPAAPGYPGSHPGMQPPAPAARGYPGSHPGMQPPVPAAPGSSTMPPRAQSGMYPGTTLQAQAPASGYPGSHPGMQPPFPAAQGYPGMQPQYPGRY